MLWQVWTQWSFHVKLSIIIWVNAVLNIGLLLLTLTDLSATCVVVKFRVKVSCVGSVDGTFIKLPSSDAILWTDMMQLTFNLKMTTAQVVETSVTVNNNSPIQDYVHPDDHTQPTCKIMHCFWRFLACVILILLGHLSIIDFIFLIAAFWRLILCLSVIYELALIFLLFQVHVWGKGVN